MISYINNNYRSAINCDDVSALFGMSNDGANRCFKRGTGRSIMDYIIDLRLGFSAEKLITTTMTVSDICYQSGFNNLSYFTRRFRSKYNCTPLEFRSRFAS